MSETMYKATASLLKAAKPGEKLGVAFSSRITELTIFEVDDIPMAGIMCQRIRFGSKDDDYWLSGCQLVAKAPIAQYFDVVYIIVKHEEETGLPASSPPGKPYH